MATTQLVDEVERTLREAGLRGLVRLLNAQTLHRFTGVYRFDRELLHNLAFFDRKVPEVSHDTDTPMNEAYSASIDPGPGFLQFEDARHDPQVTTLPGSPVVAYCGALIRTSSGDVFGSLCHFDVLPCRAPAGTAELLLAVAPLLYPYCR